jgi:hypothetical protein
MTPAYYTRSASGYTPTDFVTGPWDPDMCHAGPPSALILNEIARAAPGMGITRASFEIPRGIPKVPCRVTIDELRGGNKIRLLRAELRTESDDLLMSANVWCIRETDGLLPVSDPHALTLPPPEECEPLTFEFGTGVDYMDGVEMLAASGQPFRGGPGAIWIRQIIPLIEGETADLYSLCGMFGDLGNGIAAMEPLSELMAINTDLTVYLSRRPRGEWVAIESFTISHGLGLGMTDSLLYDASGFVGKANQSIFFDRY